MRLATFNILHGRSLDDGLVDLARFVAAIRLLDADVLALQEVDRDQPRSQLADLTALAAEAMGGAVSHRFVSALSGTPGAAWVAACDEDKPGKAAYGVSLLSRYPVRSWEVVRLPRIPFRFPIWLPDAGRVVVVHDEPRVAVIARLDTPAGPLVVANTHLSYIPGWGRFQLSRLRHRLAAVSGPVVLLGDLNLPAPKPARITRYRALASHLTYPLDTPNRQLDHILLRGSWGEVAGSSAPRLQLSDHRALVVDLADPVS